MQIIQNETAGLSFCEMNFLNVAVFPGINIHLLRPLPIPYQVLSHWNVRGLCCTVHKFILSCLLQENVAALTDIRLFSLLYF